MKRFLVVIVLLALGGAAGALGLRRYQEREREAAAGALRLYGNVELRDAQLAFFGEERVAEVLVEEGDAVAPGELLARLRTERLEAELAAARARVDAQAAQLARLENGTRPQELARAEAAIAADRTRVENAERVIERLRSTTESGASSAQELDDARAELDLARAALRADEEALDLLREGPRVEEIEEARAQLAVRRAELALQERRLADSELRAPAAGFVQSRILEPGEMASPGRPALSLALTEPKWIRAWLPEPQLGRVAPGAAATVRSDAFAGREYPGMVSFVSPVAEFTPKAVETEELRTRLVYELRVLVEDPRNELRLGAPVTVELSTEAGE